MTTLSCGKHNVTAIERDLLDELLLIEPWCEHLSDPGYRVGGCAHCETMNALDGLENDAARCSGQPVPNHHRRVL